MNGTMRTALRGSLLAAAALVIMVPATQGDDDLDELLDGSGPDKIVAKGAGTYGIAGTTADFEMKAKQKRGRSAKGDFRQTLVFQGLLIDFIGEVTCMAVDPLEGRAWIGGIVTENNSDHPAFTTELNEPGDDVWFRVLDTGKGSEEPDRTTFLGFEGGGGIITSEEYCQARIWPGPPDDVPNARTNALLEGKIKVKAIDDDDDSDSDSDSD